MSWKRVDSALKLKGLTVAEKLILMSIASCENIDTGKCNPSQDYIAKMLEVSRKYVNENVSALLEKGVLLRKRTGSSSEYSFGFSSIPDENHSSHLQKDDENHRLHRDENHRLHRDENNSSYHDENHSSHKPVIEPESEPVKEPPPPTVSTVAKTANTVGTVGGGDEEYPQKKDDTPPKPKIVHPGLKWMSGYRPYTDPFDLLFAEKHCSFLTAYSPGCGIEGNTLTPKQVETIEDSPIDSALAVIGESSNAVTRKALASRLSWIGKEYFVGEVVRIASEVKDGTITCDHLGKTLLRRLEYVFAFQVSTDNFTQEYDIHRLWDVALGLISIAA